MAFAADGLQVDQLVIAAIGFGDTVIHFSSYSHAAFRFARLAQAAITLHYLCAKLSPVRTVTPLSTRSATGDMPTARQSAVNMAVAGRVHQAIASGLSADCFCLLWHGHPFIAILSMHKRKRPRRSGPLYGRANAPRRLAYKKLTSIAIAIPLRFCETHLQFLV